MKGSKLIRSFVTEAKEEAQVQTLREAVAEVLEGRFGEVVPAEITTLLEPIDDPEQLRTATGDRSPLRSPEEFRAGLAVSATAKSPPRRRGRAGRS